MKRPLALLLLSSCATVPPTAPGSAPILGFTENQAAHERDLEARLDGLVRPDHLREWMKRLSARPHHLGSPYDKENAQFIASLFTSWGYETAIEEFQVLFPIPKTRILEMTAPAPFKASLEEPAIPEDQTSSQKSEQLPVYNAYSIDGDVTGELVYVNFGVPKDYEELERRGIDVRGKIVLARYYGSWRGIKPKVAHEHGAIGCIIYSDPHEDGYFQGDVYPRGAYRSARGAQRGSVMDLPLYPGDPLTPGVGATPSAKRLPLKDAATLTKIPVLPISYDDAFPLLQGLGGAVAPEPWRGALPTTYHLGPGPTKVHLKLEFDWTMATTYNVIARLPGSERPEEWILRGNHHDAWVNGAEDPVSAQVSLLEEARILGELAKSGWRPKRTVIYCAWDGEEEGLLGSTEWAEAHAAELRAHGAVYINSDGNGRGFFSAAGSHSLEKLVNQAARDVTDPHKEISVAERLRAQRLLRGSAEEQKEARERAELRLGALGSGSDYTVFIDHLGIASLNVGFGGESGGGIYHSIYDSFDWYVRFGDPDFSYGAALVKTAGRLILRLANADLLPYEFIGSAEAIAGYAKEVAKLADDSREETVKRNRLIQEGRFEAAADPREPFVSPKPQDPVPPIDFAPLKTAVGHLEASARTHDRARADMGELPLETKRRLEEVLLTCEQALTREEGLPRRPWYRHQIYAPGFYTGYGVKTLPAIREALEERRWDEAKAGILSTSAAIERYAEKIDEATGILRAR